MCQPCCQLLSCARARILYRYFLQRSQPRPNARREKERLKTNRSHSALKTSCCRKLNTEYRLRNVRMRMCECVQYVLATVLLYLLYLQQKARARSTEWQEACFVTKVASYLF